MIESVVTLLVLGDRQVSVRFECGDALVTETTALPSDEVHADLMAQLRSERPSSSALRLLSLALGEILYAGEVGDAIRSTYQDAHEGCILLACDSRLTHWPWELSRDPETETCPALDEVSIIRLLGAPSSMNRQGDISRRAVLVVPEDVGGGHLTTLQAATRPLGRKLEIDVFPSEPATGPGLRRTLGSGAVFVHFEATTTATALNLDDGPVPADRLGLGAGTYLVVLGGTDPTSSIAPSLRTLGCTVVVALQAALDPVAAAAFSRELYRALAAGVSVAEAVRRCRKVLLRFGGSEGAAWAAPIVFSAPAHFGQAVPALQPFPPPAILHEQRDPGSVLSAFQALESGGGLVLEAQEPKTPQRPVDGPIISAPIFIHDTIRAIREGQHSQDLSSRIGALRELGGNLSLDASHLEDLSPAERTTRLADHLVAALARPDYGLVVPGEAGSLAGRVEDISERAGLDGAAVMSLAMALLGAPVVALDLRDDPSSSPAALARDLCRAVFDRLVVVHRADEPERLLSGPIEGGASGALLETANLNWRRAEVDPFGPDATQTDARMKVVLPRSDGSFSVHEGAWLLVHTSSLLEGQLPALLDALESRVLSGRTGPHHRPYWARLPRDFRVILLGRIPEAFKGRVPTIRLASSDLGNPTLAASCVASAQAELAAPTTPAEATRRARIVDALLEPGRLGGTSSTTRTRVALAAFSSGLPADEAVQLALASLVPA